MIYAFTGSPGAGKTCSAISFLLNDERFKNRQVYCHNVTDLNIPEWQQIDQQQAIEWYDLPNDSVVFIDECQEIWRPVLKGGEPPKTIQKLERHRHHGIDIVFTCQYPRQIHIGVRRMVTTHYHLYRPSGGKISQLKYGKMEDSPQDFHAIQRAEKSRFQPDKQVFDKYKSATMHTVKKTIPKMAIYLPLIAISVIALIFFVYNHITGLSESYKTEEIAQVDSDLPFNPIQRYTTRTQSKDQPKTIKEYLEARTPRIPEIPSSAPIYDEVKKINSYPRLQCVYQPPKLEGAYKPQTCVCYTQQATKLSTISIGTCLHIVNHGRSFDPHMPDYALEPDKDRSRPVAIERDEESAHSRSSSPRITVVPYRGRPSYPTARNSYGGIP